MSKTTPENSLLVDSNFALGIRGKYIVLNSDGELICSVPHHNRYYAVLYANAEALLDVLRKVRDGELDYTSCEVEDIIGTILNHSDYPIRGEIVK